MTRHPDPLRLNIKQAICRYRNAKRDLEAAPTGSIAMKNAAGDVDRTEACARFWVKHYRENRVFRDVRRAA